MAGAVRAQENVVVTGNKLTGLTDPKAVTAAMKEFRHLGRDQFIAEYSKSGSGFRRSTDFFVLEGRGSLRQQTFDGRRLRASAWSTQRAPFR